MGEPSEARGQVGDVVLRIESALEELRTTSPPTSDAVDRLVTEATVGLEELVVAEEELRAQTEELASSRDSIDAERERYVDLFEAIPDAVIETDLFGKILDANSAAGDLLALPLRALRGKLVATFVMPAQRRAMRRAVGDPPDEELMVTIEARDGVLRQVALRLRRWERAHSPTLLWVLRDLSRVTDLEHRATSAGVSVALYERLVPLQLLAVSPEPAPSLIARAIGATEELFEDVALVVRIDDHDPVTGARELGNELAAAEAHLGEGPLIDAVTTGRPVLVAGLELSRRWPTVGRRALELGASSVVTVPILVDGEPTGAVAAWERDGRPPQETLHLASIIADQLATATATASVLDQARGQESNLRRALETRGAIERAKGMLMHARGISADEAFDVLRRASQRDNRKLRDVAVEVTEGRSTELLDDAIGSEQRTS